MLSVENWAEVRRLHRAEGMPIKTIARVMGIRRNTVRAALRSVGPPKYERTVSGSIVDAVEPRIRELLQAWPTMPATVIAERIGWGRSIRVLSDRVADLRPVYLNRPGFGGRATWAMTPHLPTGSGLSARGSPHPVECRSGAPGSLVGSCRRLHPTREVPMRARDLAEPFPLVLPDTDALEAARSMAAERRPGLIVCDKDGRPYTVLAGPELLRVLLPAYLCDNPLLARTLDEGASDDLARSLPRRTVRHLLPRPADLDDLALVRPEATALEVATVMARADSPLVAVYDGHQVIGAVTVDRLLEHLLPADGA